MLVSYPFCFKQSIHENIFWLQQPNYRPFVPTYSFWQNQYMDVIWRAYLIDYRSHCTRWQTIFLKMLKILILRHFHNWGQITYRRPNNYPMKNWPRICFPHPLSSLFGTPKIFFLCHVFSSIFCCMRWVVYCKHCMTTYRIIIYVVLVLILDFIGLIFILWLSLLVSYRPVFLLWPTIW